MFCCGAERRLEGSAQRSGPRVGQGLSGANCLAMPDRDQYLSEDIRWCALSVAWAAIAWASALVARVAAGAIALVGFGADSITDGLASSGFVPLIWGSFGRGRRGLGSDPASDFGDGLITFDEQRRTSAMRSAIQRCERNTTPPYFRPPKPVTA